MTTHKPAWYATSHSVGRRHKTAPDPYRGEFRRDIGRVLYSRAFRRLAFKTQVFSPSKSDHYRNRLTHTLETAQIARVAAENLGLNGELAEAIALAHDLGHPPFGHQGEAVLDRLMAVYGGFDHNLQNVRIVTMLEVKADRFPGLNLTWETIYGIAKSGAARDFIRRLYNLPPEHRIDTAEARVADLADDMAYTATDFDDYACYRELSIADLRAMDLELIARALPEGVGDVRIAVSMCVRNLVSMLVSDMIAASRERIESLNPQTSTNREVIKRIGLSDEIGREYDQLARFLRRNMYDDARLKAETLHGARALETLFEEERKRRRLSPGDREGFFDLCDYISGMTDRYALARVESLNTA